MEGLQNGDAITASYSTPAVAASSVGSYAITPGLSDPSNKLSNYTVTLNPGTLSEILKNLPDTGAVLIRDCQHIPNGTTHPD